MSGMLKGNTKQDWLKAGFV